MDKITKDYIESSALSEIDKSILSQSLDLLESVKSRYGKDLRIQRNRASGVYCISMMVDGGHELVNKEFDTPKDLYNALDAIDEFGVQLMNCDFEENLEWIVDSNHCDDYSVLNWIIDRNNGQWVASQLDADDCLDALQYTQELEDHDEEIIAQALADAEENSLPDSRDLNWIVDASADEIRRRFADLFSCSPADSIALKIGLDVLVDKILNKSSY